MTTDEREARLTAYALNDPGLSEPDRLEVEALLRTDPAARQAVEETLKLAQLLTAGLAAEQAAQPADKPVTIPSSLARRPRIGGWRTLAAVAAVLMVAVAAFMAVELLTRQNPVAQSNHASPAGPTDPAGESPDVNLVEGGNDLGDVAKADKQTTRESGIATADGRARDDNSVYEARQRGDVGQSDSAAGKKPSSVAPATTASPPPPPGYSQGTGIGGIGGFGGAPGMGLPGRPGSGGGIQGGIGGIGGGIGGIGGTPPSSGGIGGIGGFGGAPGGPPGPAVPAAGGLRPTDAVVPPRLPGNPAPGTDPQIDNTETEHFKRFGRSYRTAGDRYGELIENSFTTVEGEAALSTFGVDVDTASYAIVRKYLGMGQLPPASAVRLEELVNYFRYQDKAPDGDDPFAVTVEVAECPWQPKHRLARIGLKAKPIDTDKRPPSNLVFLIDVSGSMAEPNKLPYVKTSLRMLVNQLGENDRVAMVVYAGASGLVLDSTSAAKKDVILGALDRLEAGGSTNGAGGLQQAYDVAVANFIKNGTNRVILCTDGDWNVGVTGTDALVKLIEEKRKTGVFLSVFGFGMGNLRDEMMVKLAGKGNGNYGYIDTLKEAHKALVEQLGGTLVTVAKDVKIQVEFNPATVQAYRLLGYEKRALAAKDFADDKKDAGEMGAGHVVTALYELVPAGLATPAAKGGAELRYQKPAPAPKPAVRADVAKEAFVVKMRHKKPDGDTSTLRELPVTDTGKSYGEASEDFRFAAAVASFAMLLRDSQYKGESSFALVQELADSARKYDPSGYREEFMEMIRLAKKLTGK